MWTNSLLLNGCRWSCCSRVCVCVYTDHVKLQQKWTISSLATYQTKKKRSSTWSLLKCFKCTDPSSLPIHMNAPDMLCQIRTGVEALWTEVPAAGVSYCLGVGGAGAALFIQHNGGGAPTGHCALHLHQGAADTEREERVGLVERKKKRGQTQSKC